MTIKIILIDFITQTVVEGKAIHDDMKNEHECLNPKRNVRFGLWSGIYCGSFQHYLFNIFYQSVFVGNSYKIPLIKAMVHNFITIPLWEFPLYFSFKSLVMGGNIMDGLNNYKNNGWEVCVVCWKFWIPGMFMAFMLPIQYRILFVGSLSLFWMTILSYLQPMIKNNDDNIDRIFTDELLIDL